MSDKLLELARAVVAKEPVSITHKTQWVDFGECVYCHEDTRPEFPYDLEHAADCPWLLLKQEVERIDALNESVAEINPRADFRQRREEETDKEWRDRVDASKAIYKRKGEGLKFAEPCKPQPYQIGGSHGG